jgi:hypothetical protein
MGKFLSFLLCVVSFGAAAANHDQEGFVWLDANTKIKVLKPVSAGGGETKAPEEPKKDKKPEKAKK